MNRSELSERDICTKFITSALEAAGWDWQAQLFPLRRRLAARRELAGKLVGALVAEAGA